MAFAAAGAGILFGISVGGMAVFLRTSDQRFDRIAEWAFVAFAIVCSAVILAVPGRLGGAEPVRIGLTVLGLAAVAAVGLGELGPALRLVDFRRTSLVVAAGFAAFLAWVGAVSVLVIGDRRRGLPAGIGWLGLAAIVIGLGLIALIVRRPGVMSGEREPDPRLMTAFALPAAAIVAWLAWLGPSL